MLPRKVAIQSILWIVSLMIVFHFLILFQFISYEVVWAGRLSSLEEMRVFEGISIFVNLLFITTVLILKKGSKRTVINRIVHGVLWGYFVLFSLNTIGNLFAKNWIEWVFGTLLTALLSYLCWCVLRSKK